MDRPGTSFSYADLAALTGSVAYQDGAAALAALQAIGAPTTLEAVKVASVNPSMCSRVRTTHVPVTVGLADLDGARALFHRYIDSKAPA